MLALAATMTEATPPCSRAYRVPGDRLERSIQPTLVLPMKEKKEIFWSVTN